MAHGRILVVEADQSITAPLRTALEEEGYAVQVAGSATRAVADVGACDLALVSLTLPDTDGVELVTALLGRCPGLPIVAITPQPAQGFTARAVGAYTFLEVPHDLTREKILTVAANALEHKALLEQLTAARQAGSATLNLEERERQAILSALEATQWNKQGAARLLGLHRPTLYSKMRKHGVPQKRPAST